MWLATTAFLAPLPTETVERRIVRFRTVGDATCTGAIDSPAATVQQIIEDFVPSDFLLSYLAFKVT
jgi:sulfate adenylyltransferase subunit 2